MPTRIIRKPVKVKPRAGKHGTNTTHKIYLISCDDGRNYTIDRLSAIVGMSRQGLDWRIRVLGWDHPQIFAAKVDTDTDYGEDILIGNDEWRKLSAKPRNERLETIPAGIWEEQQIEETINQEEEP